MTSMIYLISRDDIIDNLNVEHDIITRDAYNVSWAEIWEFSKSQRDIIDAVTISKIIMPPPLGAGGIMFSGCPSVRPSEAWNTLFWPVHGSVGPPDQP